MTLRKIWRLALGTLVFLLGLGVFSMDATVSNLDGLPASWSAGTSGNRNCVGLSADAVAQAPRQSTGFLQDDSLTATLGMDGDCSGFPKDC